MKIYQRSLAAEPHPFVVRCMRGPPAHLRVQRYAFLSKQQYILWIFFKKSTKKNKYYGPADKYTLYNIYACERIKKELFPVAEQLLYKYGPKNRFQIPKTRLVLLAQQNFHHLSG